MVETVTIEWAMGERAHQGDKKEQETSHANIAAMLVAGWEQCSQTPSAGVHCPPITLHELPCNYLGIIISAGLFIVHRGQLLPTEILFLFCKRVPGAQGKKSYVQRQETLKGEEENGFCQVVCTVPLLFPLLFLK